MGKIIVIEGTDFSGKTTQYELLKKRLNEAGYEIGTDSFPNYEDASSFFVREYLQGAYGKHAQDVDAKAASLFYALDRFDSFKKHAWGKDYLAGKDILFARYITSNVVHQAAKYKDLEEKKKFTDWLYNVETGILGLPKEDVVFFLDMPIEKIIELKKERLKEQQGKTSSGGTFDVHEEDINFLRDSYDNAKFLGNYLGWVFISCVDEENNIRSIEDINNEIYEKVIEIINN